MFINVAVCVLCLQIRNDMDKDGEEGQSQACTVPPKKVCVKALLFQNSC
jgi:hypothetical protein